MSQPAKITIELTTIQQLVECEELAQYLRDSMDRIRIKWQQLKEL